jgi:copper homeostasis protein
LRDADLNAGGSLIDIRLRDPRAPRVLIEACVTSARSARAAERAGADRVELCARLETGGLTPAAHTLDATRRATRCPVHVLVRPHARGFVYDHRARARISTGILLAQAGGAQGVVLGALTSHGLVDVELMADLIAASRPLRVTFHRAFDTIRQRDAALEALIAVGVDHVLTSGGAGTAADGAGELAELVRRARGRIGIIAAGRVRGSNVQALVAATGVPAVHAHTPAADLRALARALGR